MRPRRAPGGVARSSNLGAALLGRRSARAAAARGPRALPGLAAARHGRDMGAPSRGALAQSRSGASRRGRPVPPWTMDGIAEAGALMGTAADLLRLARAVARPPAGALGPGGARPGGPAVRGSRGAAGREWDRGSGIGPRLADLAPRDGPRPSGTTAGTGPGRELACRTDPHSVAVVPEVPAGAARPSRVCWGSRGVGLPVSARLRKVVEKMAGGRRPRSRELDQLPDRPS